MAIKEKVSDENKKSRLMEILGKDYKWESYLFIFLSIVLIILGTFILNGTLQVKNSVPVIGAYPTPFAVILIILGVLSLGYALYPFFKLAFPELKKVKWPTWSKFLSDTCKTFIFMITFTLLFLMFDVIISELLKRWFSL